MTDILFPPIYGMTKRPTEQTSIPLVAVVVINWNAWQDTLECLESILNLNYPRFQVILVDNGSVDLSVQKIKEWAKSRDVFLIEYDQKAAIGGGLSSQEVRLENRAPDRKAVFIRLKENLGFSEGNNVAIKYALNCAHPAEFVFLLNNDTRIDRKCLSYAVRLTIEKNADIVGCLIKDQQTGKRMFTGDHRPSELFYFSYFWFRHHLKDYEHSNMAWGTAMLLGKKALKSMENTYGYFLDPRLFLYMEDIDFSIKIRKLGFQIYQANRAVVFHKNFSSCVKKKYQNSFLLYYSTRNTLLVAKSLLSGLWLLMFHIYFPVLRLKDVFLKLSKRKFREAQNILEGLRDGYRGVSGKWHRHP